MQVLTDGANEATSAIADTASKVMALAESLEESGIASMEQVEQLKSLFPDTYRQALIIENDQIKINTQAMKDLMVARAEELVSKAQEAVDSIKADNAVAESALQRANFIISATRAEIRANASMSESDRERAQNTINAAKSEIAAINEAAKARGVSLTNAENNLALAQAYLAQIKNTSYNYADLAKAADKAASSTNSLSEAQKAYNDLLEITIKMLKQEKQDQIDALEKELDNYKKIIDAKKESLDLDKEAIDYQKNLADKNKVLSDIDNELLQIQFDNSEEGKKRRLELEAERAEAVEEINELQADRSYEIQKDALDREYETYKESMENRIAALQDYLEQEGTIRNEAIALLQARTDEFYRSLIEWNRIYGSGIDSDIIDKWAIADSTVQTFASNANSALGGVGSAVDTLGNKLKAVYDYYNSIVGTANEYMLWRTTNRNTSDYEYTAPRSGTISYHNGGMVGVETHHDGNVAGGLPKIKESEVFAKLLKGEVVATESQMKNFINNTLPALSTNISGGTNIGNIQLSFNIAGDLDRSVVPDIKNIITETLMDITKSRGVLRNANSFSL